MHSADSVSSSATARLVWRVGSLEQRFRVTGTHRIGRHPDNELQLLDKIASKAHCVIERRGNACYLRDLHSLNGTYVNARRVGGECRLRHSDQITIGSTVLRFEQPSSLPDGAAVTSNDRRFVSAVGGLLDAQNVEATFTGVLRVAIDLSGADWGALILLEPTGVRRLEPITLLAGRSSPPQQLDFDVSLVSQALLNRAVAERVESGGDAYRAWKPRTLVAVPLVCADTAFGVLWLERQGASGGGAWLEIGLLGRLAALVAGALAGPLRGLPLVRPD